MKPKDIKGIFLLGLMVFLALPIYSQTLSKKEQRQLEKEMKKEQKAEEAARRAEVVDAMVTYQRFVLEANQLRDRRGNSLQVNSQINFLASDSITGVIQVGQNAYVGQNGVGGVTVEGPVVDYTYTKNKKNDTYRVHYYLRTTLGTYDVNMVVSPNGRAEATVSSATWGGRITYSGYLVPVGISRVFKGTPM